MRTNASKFLFVAGSMLISTIGLAGPSLADGLAFDADHDVLALPDCELTVKYNNKTFVPVKTTSYTNNDNHFLERPVIKALKVSEDFTNMTISQSPETVIIECYDFGQIGVMSPNRFSKDFLKTNHVREVSYPNDRISRETGLPIPGLQSLKAISSFEVKPKDGGEPYNLFAFQHDQHLTVFARRMRSGRADVKNDPPVIVMDLRVGKIGDSRANIEISGATESNATK